MISSTDRLKANWDNSLQPFSANPTDADRLFGDLVAAYSSGDRFYHNLAHIQQVLEAISQARSLARNLPEIQLAAWFHDVIYNPKAKDNEDRSAEYAAAVLDRLNLPTEAIANIKTLILTTRTHQPLPENIDSQIFLDADLSILGSSDSDYQAYTRAIRQEYAWLSDREYRDGRLRILQNLWQRQRLYHTPQFFVCWEQQARKNLQAEIHIHQHQLKINP